MINEMLNSISTMISQNFWIAPLLAFLAGILTSITPCSLSSIPLVIGYVSGTTNDTKKSFKLSVTFALGSALTFTALGVIAATAGSLMGNSSKIFYVVIGILMVAMSLQVFGIFEFIPSSYLVTKNNKKGYIGALIAGILSGLFSSPCCTPVLVALLGIVAKSGNILLGTMLLLIYSIGHSILMIAAGTSTSLVKKIISNKRYGVFSTVLNYVFGLAILAIGMYMLYLGF